MAGNVVGRGRGVPVRSEFFVRIATALNYDVQLLCVLLSWIPISKQDQTFIFVASRDLF